MDSRFRGNDKWGVLHLSYSRKTKKKGQNIFCPYKHKKKQNGRFSESPLRKTGKFVNCIIVKRKRKRDPETDTINRVPTNRYDNKQKVRQECLTHPEQVFPYNMMEFKEVLSKF